MRTSAHTPNRKHESTPAHLLVHTGSQTLDLGVTDDDRGLPLAFGDPSAAAHTHTRCTEGHACAWGRGWGGGRQQQSGSRQGHHAEHTELSSALPSHTPAAALGEPLAAGLSVALSFRDRAEGLSPSFALAVSLPFGPTEAARITLVAVEPPPSAAAHHTGGTKPGAQKLTTNKSRKETHKENTKKGSHSHHNQCENQTTKRQSGRDGKASVAMCVSHVQATSVNAHAQSHSAPQGDRKAGQQRAAHARAAHRLSSSPADPATRDLAPCRPRPRRRDCPRTSSWAWSLGTPCPQAAPPAPPS
jgi:hypothetical protein